jgi:hypothetical protein
MALDLANIGPSLKTKFEEPMQEYIRFNSVLPQLLRREGTPVYDDEFKYVEFSFPVQQSGTMRGYGLTDPDVFDDCEGSIKTCSARIELGFWFAPLRIKQGAKMYGKKGAMGAPYEYALKELPLGVAKELDRWIGATTGNTVYFQLDGVGTDNGDGTTTFSVKNYGGLANQPIGVILERLHLEGIPLQASSAVGVASPNPADAVVVVAVDATLGAETITVEGVNGGPDFFGAAIGDDVSDWIVFRAQRTDLAGTVTQTTGLKGLPVLIDDFTVETPFQNVTDDRDYDGASEGCHDVCYAPLFKSKVLGDPLNPVPLTEDQMIDMIEAAEIRSSATRTEDGISLVRHFFFGNSVTHGQAAKMALGLRQLTSESRMWSEKGVKPHMGVEKKAFHVNGIPFFHSPDALLADLFLIDAAGLSIYQNGPIEGQWLMAGGDREIRVPCTTKTEIVWFGSGQLGVHNRMSMVRRRGIQWPDANEVISNPPANP